jgi:hypothetical protein
MLKQIFCAGVKGVDVGNVNPLNVCIFDEQGKVFLRPFTTHFNLPKGNYTINTDFNFCEPVRYKKIILPKRERNIKFPKKFKVIQRPNKNKCSIYYELGLIVFDPEFFNSLNKFQHYFVCAHEIGHYFYKTEKYCDLFSAKKMIQNGYNATQILAGCDITLSNTASSIERKNYLLKHLKK